jgi:hypothetical protein
MDDQHEVFLNRHTDDLELASTLIDADPEERPVELNDRLSGRRNRGPDARTTNPVSARRSGELEPSSSADAHGPCCVKQN